MQFNKERDREKYRLRERDIEREETQIDYMHIVTLWIRTLCIVGRVQAGILAKLALRA